MQELIKKHSEIVAAKESLHKEYEQEVAKLQERYMSKIEDATQNILALERAAKLLGINLSVQSDAPAIDKVRKDKPEISIGDAIQKALTEAGKPLTIDEITVKFPEYGLDTAKSSIRATLSIDSRKRFVRVAQGVYDLAERVQDIVTLSAVSAG